MLNLTILANQHSSQDTKKTYSCWISLMTLISRSAFPPKKSNLAGHTFQTKWTNRCWTWQLQQINIPLPPRYQIHLTHLPKNTEDVVKFNNLSRSTFLQLYQTQPTYLPNTPASVDLYSFSRKTFPQDTIFRYRQNTLTDVEFNKLSWSIFPSRYQTHLI